jgi:hypothetical protein
MLQISDLTRIIGALTRQPGHKDTSVLRIALAYLVKGSNFQECSIILIDYKRSTFSWGGLTVYPKL